jgi:hypothetical protein
MQWLWSDHSRELMHHSTFAWIKAMTIRRGEKQSLGMAKSHLFGVLEKKSSISLVNGATPHEVW